MGAYDAMVPATSTAVELTPAEVLSRYEAGMRVVEEARQRRADQEARARETAMKAAAVEIARRDRFQAYAGSGQQQADYVALVTAKETRARELRAELDAAVRAVRARADQEEAELNARFSQQRAQLTKEYEQRVTALHEAQLAAWKQGGGR